jgi:hypothetical protein
MGIDHRGFDILVPQQLLHGTVVVTGLQQVGGKAMAKGVRANRFIDLRQFRCCLYCSLQNPLGSR